MSRPWKYDVLILALEDKKPYTASRVVRHGAEAGMFDRCFDYPERTLAEPEKRASMRRARSSLSLFVQRHLPPTPDCHIDVKRPFPCSYPAFWGATWKRALRKTKDNQD